MSHGARAGAAAVRTPALALYNKQQRQVSSAAAATPASVPTGAKHPISGTADAPLQPAAISRLQEQIKALAPARLEAFSKGFLAVAIEPSRMAT